MLWNRFKNVVSIARDNAVPLKKKIRNIFPLWETKEVREARKMRNKAERVFLLTKTEAHKVERNNASQLLKQCAKKSSQEF